MTPEQFHLLIGTSLLPVLADFIEDYPMARTAKHERDKIVQAIRSYDRIYMDKAPIEVIEQQVQLQQWFRQTIELEFNALQK